MIDEVKTPYLEILRKERTREIEKCAQENTDFSTGRALVYSLV